ncbi:MAG: thiol peroxidase [Thermodesulfovibrionales bacterium]|nr:thiol peroxidase [Thermodesulfovibrionales bacterium]
MERKGVITFKGMPLTLIGNELKVGDKALDFLVLDNNLNITGLKNFTGKIKVISVTPSIDTPVCDLQARRFNAEAANLSQDVLVLNISMDLPFALSRFCTTAGINRVLTFSDHKDASFGNAYGVMIKELRLLTRAVFIIDKDDIIRYIEIVPEITSEPNYERALEALKKLSI